MMYLSSALCFFLVSWLQLTQATIDQPTEPVTISDMDRYADGRRMLQLPDNITMPALIRCAFKESGADYYPPGSWWQPGSISIPIPADWENCHQCEKILYEIPVTASIDVENNSTETGIQCTAEPALEMQYNVSQTVVIKPVRSKMFVWDHVPAVEEGFNFTCSCSECATIKVKELVRNQDGVLVDGPDRCAITSHKGIPHPIECSGTTPGLSAAEGLLMLVEYKVNTFGGPNYPEITVRCDADVDPSALLPENIEEEEEEEEATMPALIRCQLEQSQSYGTLEEYQQPGSIPIPLPADWDINAGTCTSSATNRMICERIQYEIPVTASIDVENNNTDTELQCTIEPALEMQYNVSQTAVIKPVKSKLFVWNNVPAVEEGFNFTCSCSDCASITVKELVRNEEGALVEQSPLFDGPSDRCFIGSSRWLPAPLECSGTIPGLAAAEGLLMLVKYIGQDYGRPNTPEITVRCDAHVDPSTLLVENIEEEEEEEEAESTANTTNVDPSALLETEMEEAELTSNSTHVDPSVLHALETETEESESTSRADDTSNNPSTFSTATIITLAVVPFLAWS